MAVQTREDIKMYALRALGYPLVEIDITPEAMDDRIEEALAFFYEHYFDGSQKVFYKHQVVDEDITNGYITVPSNIWGITDIFPFSNSASTQPNIFDLQYQLRANDLRDITSSSLIYYEQVMEHISMIDNMLTTKRQFRFNRNTDRLYIDMNWSNRVTPGSWLLIECYSIVDPDENAKMWNNRLLKEYIIALFKKQWAMAYSKFDNIQLPGGVSIDGKSMYADAKGECEEIEQQIMDNQAPFGIIIG
jgi:hypothetical protein